MGGRYLVTGVQLGILKMTANRAPDALGSEAMNLIDHILEKQFVADSDELVEEDVARIYLEKP